MPKPLKEFHKGYIMFAGSDTPAGITAAKEYISKNKWNSEDVRLSKNDKGDIAVIAKRIIRFPEDDISK